MIQTTAQPPVTQLEQQYNIHWVEIIFADHSAKVAKKMRFEVGPLRWFSLRADENKVGFSYERTWTTMDGRGAEEATVRAGWNDQVHIQTPHGLFIVDRNKVQP
jgi:hypothetical protein